MSSPELPWRPRLLRTGLLTVALLALVEGLLALLFSPKSLLPYALIAVGAVGLALHRRSRRPPPPDPLPPREWPSSPLDADAVRDGRTWTYWRVPRAGELLRVRPFPGHPMLNEEEVLREDGWYHYDHFVRLHLGGAGEQPEPVGAEVAAARVRALLPAQVDPSRRGLPRGAGLPHPDATD